jgi:hypothetical protein
MNEIITTTITTIFGIENGMEVEQSHSLTLRGNEKAIGITITTRNNGLFENKTKNSHFDIWSI